MEKLYHYQPLNLSDPSHLTDILIDQRIHGLAGSGRFSRKGPFRRYHRCPNSPDGSRFVFTSTRSGTAEIWISNRDGSNARQVTRQGAFCGSPSWSPDQTMIAYDSQATGKTEIWLVSVATGTARLLNPDGAPGFAPSWSHDGKWVYYCGHGGIWKRPVGGGPEEKITSDAGFQPMESADLATGRVNEL